MFIDAKVYSCIRALASSRFTMRNPQPGFQRATLGARPDAGFDSSPSISALLCLLLGYDVFIGVVHLPGAAGDRAPQIPGPEA
jgi:hypothetical protein